MNDRFIDGLLIALYPAFILIGFLFAGFIIGEIFGKDKKSTSAFAHRIRK